MKRKILAVCDLEADYARSFAQYLDRKNQVPFEVHAFTTPQSLVEFAGEHPIALLLISAKALTREVRALDVGKLIVLSEGEEVEGGYDSVYKYQATSQVVQEALAVYGETAPAGMAFPVLRKTVTVYGVYSPLGRCGKTTFALALGQELARTQPTLYLSLEGLSGLDGLMRVKADQCFSDLLYYARLREPGLSLRAGACVRTVEHLDYIPAVRIPDDIRQAQWGDLEYLISGFVTHSAYEALVLDIGNDLCDPFRAMEECRVVFEPVLEDLVSSCKLEQFRALLEDKMYEELRGKLRPVHVPEISMYLTPGTYVESLLWSEVGDCARTALRALEREG